MPNRCETCDHPQRAYIDKRILAGHSLPVIAREMRFSYPSLRNHRAHDHQLGVRRVPYYVPQKPAARP